MPRHDELGYSRIECGVCGFVNAPLSQDLVLKCEGCGQVQALPSAPREEVHVAVSDDGCTADETTGLLNFRAPVVLDEAAPACSKNCDVCSAVVQFGRGVHAARCGACQSLVLSPHAPVRAGHKPVRCRNAGCRTLFMFQTDDVSFARCPTCETLRSGDDNGTALLCRSCNRYFDSSDMFLPSIKCPHCQRSVFTGWRWGFLGWALAGIALIVIGVVFLALSLLVCCDDGKGLFVGIVSLGLGVFVLVWPFAACCCMPGTTRIDPDLVEQTVPFHEIQRPDAIDESVNQRIVI